MRMSTARRRTSRRQACKSSLLRLLPFVIITLLTARLIIFLSSASSRNNNGKRRKPRTHALHHRPYTTRKSAQAGSFSVPDKNDFVLLPPKGVDGDDYASYTSEVKPLVRKTNPDDWKPVNRTLVVLIGDLRCGEAAWKTLYNNVLDFNYADLLLVVQDVSPRSRYFNSSLFDRAIHVEILPNLTDWADAVDIWMNVSDSWQDSLARHFTAESHPTLLGGIGAYRASAAILGVYKWVVAQRLRQKGWDTAYSTIAVARTDQLYPCPLKLTMPSTEAPLWVPAGEDYGGICDRFFVADSSVILNALNVLMPLLLRPEAWPLRLTPNTNPEYLLRHMWQAQGLFATRFPRSMYTCMAANDSSRWGHVEGWDEAFQVHLKYRTEYEPTMESCRQHDIILKRQPPIR